MSFFPACLVFLRNMMETSKESSHLTHLPRVGVIKWLSDETTDIQQLPSIAEDINDLVHPGSVRSAFRVGTNKSEDYVLLGFGYSEARAWSNAKIFLDEQEKCVQSGLRQVKDTSEDKSDDEVVISGSVSYHQVSYGPEWDETLPKL